MRIGKFMLISIGPSQSNFWILDIFAVYVMWNVHILVRKIVIRGVKTKNETQNVFSIFWSSKILNWSTLAAFISWLSGQNCFRFDFYCSSDVQLSSRRYFRSILHSVQSFWPQNMDISYIINCENVQIQKNCNGRIAILLMVPVVD